MIIFVSHAHADAPVAASLVAVLRNAGLRADFYCTSLAQHGVQAGGVFEHEIRDRLNRADIVIALLSKEYFASQYCLLELGGAWTLNQPTRKLLPCLLPTVTVSEFQGPIAQLKCIALTAHDALDEVRVAIDGHRVESVKWKRARSAFRKQVEARYRGYAILDAVKRTLDSTASLQQILAVLGVERLGGSIDGPGAGPAGRELPLWIERKIGAPWLKKQVSIEAVYEVIGAEIILCYKSTWLWKDESRPRSKVHWPLFNKLAAAVRKEAEKRSER